MRRRPGSPRHALSSGCGSKRHGGWSPIHGCRSSASPHAAASDRKKHCAEASCVCWLRHRRTTGRDLAVEPLAGRSRRFAPIVHSSAQDQGSDPLDPWGAADLVLSRRRRRRDRVLLPRKGGIGAFYWSDKGFGYAIAAKADRALLPRIAELVYRADLSGRRQRQDPADAGEAQLILAE